MPPGTSRELIEMMAQPLSTPLDAAGMFAVRGWVVFPCDHPLAGAHCTGVARACREGRCKAEADPSQRGKHPRVAWGQITEPPDKDQRAAWWGGTLPTNIAIACGPSGLLVVDEDEPNAFRAFCAHEGHELPRTFTVETARGQHHYFTVPTDPATGERVPIGNSPGALAAWHCDVRGGASASGTSGGYVITAGSEHASGKIYTAPEPYAEAIEAPGWLIEAIMSPGPSTPTEGLAGADGDPGGSTRLRASDGARWDDATRYGTREDLFAQFERHCDEVSHTGGEFRFELFRAARDGWRLVHMGLLAEDEMQRALEACVWRVWEAEPNDDDMKIYWDEALPAARRSPWELTGTELRARATTATVEPGRAFLRSSEAAALAADHAVDHPDAPGVTSGDAPDDLSMDGNRPVAPARDTEQDDVPPAPPGVRRADWATAYRRRVVDTAVRDYLAAREVPPVVLLRPCDPRTERLAYLVPKMIYRDGTAVLFGASKSGKTFMALDIALSFAAGVEWRGHRITTATGERGMVWYVMAEGATGNDLRIDAWLYHHGLAREDIKDNFVSVPQRIMLTDAGVAPYLEYLAQDRPDLIVLDTKNRMFAGKEIAGDDYAAMFDVIEKMQKAAGGCAVIIIDHVGLNADDRARGSNAQQAATDTEILVVNEDGLRVAEVTKDRFAELGTRWCYRLHQVDEIERDKWVDAPAVCIPAENEPMATLPDWWLIELPEDRAEKIDKALNDKGQPAEGKKAAKDIVRIMLKVRSEQGKTEHELFTMSGEKPVIKPRGKPKPLPHSRSSIGAGVTLLVRLGALESSASGRGARYVLSEWWRQS